VIDGVWSGDENGTIFDGVCRKAVVSDSYQVDYAIGYGTFTMTWRNICSQILVYRCSPSPKLSSLINAAFCSRETSSSHTKCCKIHLEL
jgi:hypothetical protein